jgi:DNA polymerase eta
MHAKVTNRSDSRNITSTKYFTAYETTRSKQAAFPFTRNLTVDSIASAGDRLWKELVGDSKIIKVTSVQLAFTGLEATESGQQSIEGFFKTPGRGQAQDPNNGGSSLKRAREEEDILPQTIALDGESSTLASTGASSTSFTCPRCGKHVYLADHSVGKDVEDDDRAKALTMLRMEHDDFHFAQDLAKTSDESQKGRQGSSKKKKRKEPEGIAKFFSKK